MVRVSGLKRVLSKAYIGLGWPVVLRCYCGLVDPWIIERLDRKLLSRGLISYRRLVGSCSKMALDGSIIVEICDETMAKMWRKPVEM